MPFARRIVEDLGVIDVGDEDRGAPGGDPAGEAAPERDPNPLLDLLLDPVRGPRHELVRALVEQQDRGGVDAEDVDGTAQQLFEQVLELELAECRVAQPVQLPQLLESRRGRRIAGARPEQHLARARDDQAPTVGIHGANPTLRSRRSRARGCRYMPRNSPGHAAA